MTRIFRTLSLALVLALFWMMHAQATESKKASKKDTKENIDPSLKVKAASGEKQKIFYRNITNTKAYGKRTKDQYIGIKVTPPKQKGPNEFVYIEIYNYSKSYVSTINFSINMDDDWGYDLSSLVNGTDIMPGHSCVRKISVPGSGKFNPIKSVRLSGLQVLSNDAVYLKFPVYVDLVRVVN